MKIFKKSSTGSLVLFGFVLLFVMLLGQSFMQMGYFPIIGADMASKFLNDYTLSTVSLVAEYSPTTRAYTATMQDGTVLECMLSNSAIYDPRVDETWVESTEAAYAVYLESAPENIDFPQDITVKTWFYAKDDTLLCQDLTVSHVVNSASLSAEESEAMAVSIAWGMIEQLGADYNITGIDLTYSDANGSYKIDIAANSYSTLTEKDLLKNIDKI